MANLSSVTDCSDLEIVRRDGVVEVTFNRPHRHNAFTQEMYAGLRDLCEELAVSPQVKVLVLRGAGGKDRMAGQGGNDKVRGQARGDRLRGGAGDDRLAGGPGEDRCRGGSGTDSLSSCEK